MPIRIKLEPATILDSDHLLRAIKAETGQGQPFVELSETFLQNIEQKYLQSWEDWLVTLDKNLTKTIGWEEL